ncbi:MAG TPA: hypothetical protein VFZ51_06525, partial [Woeseiaceae bacterium]
MNYGTLSEKIRTRLVFGSLFAALLASALPAQSLFPKNGDIPNGEFQPPTEAFDYVKREVMIPMRDGVKLHTVIMIPKGAQNAP